MKDDRKDFKEFLEEPNKSCDKKDMEKKKTKQAADQHLSASVWVHNRLMFLHL